MRFRKKLFEFSNKNELIRDYMDGLDDPDMESFSLLSFTPLLKDEFKMEQATKEYACSYLEAARVLANADRNKNMPGVKVFNSSFSYAIPCLFLCRQAIELSIKNAICMFSGELKHTHILDDLWCDLKSVCELDNSQEADDITIVQQMDELIKTFSSLDEKSTKLRYPTNKDGTVNQTKTMFVDLLGMVKTVGNFVNQLLELELMQ